MIAKILRAVEKRLERREIEKILARIEISVREIFTQGFSIDSEENVNVAGLRADRYCTVGLGTIDFPELGGYGPVGGLDAATLKQIVAAYLLSGEKPEDGDLVVLRGVRWDVREITSEEEKYRLSIFPSVLANSSFRGWKWNRRMFQVVPETGAPRDLWAKTVNSGRMITSEGYPESDLYLLVYGLRLIHPEVL